MSVGEKSVLAGQTTRSGQLPPGPWLRALPAPGYMRNPYAFFARCRERYGDPFTVRTNALTVVTGRPDGVRQVFQAPAGAYHANLPESQGRILGPLSLSGQEGDQHRRTRRLVAPAFTSHHLLSLGQMMRATALEAIGRWVPGETMAVHDRMLEIGLDVIIKAVFGVNEAERLPAFRQAVLAFTRAFGNLPFLLLAITGLTGDRWPPNARFTRIRGQLEALISENIEERRRNGTDRPDILSQLMAARYDDGAALTDRALLDNLVNFLVAGHETSSLSLTWCFAWLSRHPDVRARLQAEVDGLADPADTNAIAKLPYLDAVIKEALRLYPAVPEVVRMVARPIEIRGWTVPPGMNVAACAALMHADPDLYPEPHAFRPERFLERRYSAFEYMPFGGGERICVGNHFGTFEVKIVLATILARTRLTLPDDGPIELRRMGFLMGPGPGRLRFEGMR